MGVDHGEDSEALPMLALSVDVPRPPILVTLKLMGTPVQFELDTGAAVTVISETEFIQLLSNFQLQKSTMKLKTYTGESMKIVGAAEVEVSYLNQKQKMLSLVVVQGSGPNLLGRNRLNHFRIDWNRIKTILQEKDGLRQLLLEYADIFADELGTNTPAKAKLTVSPSAVPRFHQPRPVPHALKPLVEQELDRLEQAGVCWSKLGYWNCWTIVSGRHP